MAKFFIIALTVTIAMQGYITWHVWRLLPAPVWVKTIVAFLMLAALACMVMQFILRDKLSMPMATAMYEIGNSWIIIALYLLIVFLVLDICQLVRLVPSTWLKANAVTSIALTCIMLATLIGGNIHYHHKARRDIQLTTKKSLNKPLRIVMLSDLHAGFHNRRSEIKKWVKLINAENPDLVLIAGDLIDSNVRPLIEQGTAEEFRQIKAPVYACMGNHEYIAGLRNSQEWLAQTGITLLRDKAISTQGVTIVGRDDRSNRHRKSVKALTQGVDKTHYVIMLDHQPFNLEQAEQAGVDLELCGHTHRGQIWPLCLITKAMYECNYGQYRKGETDYYISSGIGLWGGKFRIGTSSEYAVITVTGKNQ